MLLFAWIGWFGGAAIVGLGAWMICWALLSDRFSGNRKSRRCPKCWYDMSSVVGLKCPECGRQAKAESGLHRSRRRWKVAFLGLLLACAGAALNLAGLTHAQTWMHWLPMWAQLRLVEQLGPTPALRSLASANVTGESLADKEWTRLENAVVVTLGDPKRSNNEKRFLLNALHGLKREPIDRNRFGAAAVTFILSDPQPARTEAFVWAANLRGPAYFAEQTLATLGPQRDSRKLTTVFDCLCQQPADEERVRAIADATRRLPSRMGFSTIYPIMNANSQVFFARIAENLRNAHGSDIAEVLSPMYTLLRHSTEANESRDGIVRIAAELLASDDSSIREICRDVTDPELGEKLMPAIPALVMHLQSSNAEAKAHAKRTLLRIQLSEGSNRLLLEKLASRFCELNNSGRADAIEIFKARSPAKLPALRANIFGCLDSIDDATILTNALLSFFPDATSGVVWEPKQGSGALNSELRELLVRMVKRPGTPTAAAASWLRDHGDPAMLPENLLMEVAADRSRSAADRAAARDALLHIRDRRQPETDPLAPLRPFP